MDFGAVVDGKPWTRRPRLFIVFLNASASEYSRLYYVLVIPMSFAI